MRTFPTAQDIQQFIERGSSGQFSAEDLDAFYKKPQLWRPPSLLPTPEDAQTFWQMVWDELALEIGGRIIVPPVPRLTPKQRKSIAKYGLLLMYLPALDESRYPECFVKLDWGSGLSVVLVERRPLCGRWIAVETLPKPDQGFLRCVSDGDLFGEVLPRNSPDDDSWDGMHKNGLIAALAKAAGFPKRITRLPTAEEWSLIANLFNWLAARRGLDLPDLGSTDSWEWCENSYGDAYHLNLGNSEHGGLAAVRGLKSDCREEGLGFRLLFEL